MLAVAEGLGEISLEFAAVVGLPDQIAQRDAVAMQMLLDARGKHRAGRSTACLRKSPEQQTAADLPSGVLDHRQVQAPRDIV